MELVSLDSHKFYSLMEREDVETGRCRQQRIEHERGEICKALAGIAPGTPVAVEATGNWYWIANEIEAAGGQVKLVHPKKAKVMMGMINKTDKLDVHGLNRLQRTGTLPTIWVPPGELRDLREITRNRMTFVRQRTRLKNRIQASLGKHFLTLKGVSDCFGTKARPLLDQQVQLMPEHTQYTTQAMLAQLDFVEVQIKDHEDRIKQLVKVTPEMQLLMSIPGVGFILAAVIALELGDVNRFPSADRLASYAGTTPRVSSSGGKTHFGRTPPDVNRYLKWAFCEAGNAVAIHRNHWKEKHAAIVYTRLRERKGHAKAVGAVARHFAEASFHILNKKEPYMDPVMRRKMQKVVCSRTV